MEELEDVTFFRQARATKTPPTLLKKNAIYDLIQIGLSCWKQDSLPYSIFLQQGFAISIHQLFLFLSIMDRRRVCRGLKSRQYYAGFA